MHYITIFGSARIKKDNKYYKEAYELAKELAKAGYSVVTGGSGGVMEAANKGALDGGGASIGINVKLPNEQRTNEYCTHTSMCESLSERKGLLIQKSSAFVVMPGGFGTLDEAFEILVLACNGLKDAKIVFDNSAFWGKLLDFMRETLLAQEMIDERDFNSFIVLDRPSAVIKYLQ